jgi:glycosyltransferase involved in cell wall biosynthesis
MKVVFFQRKKSGIFFSIEELFERIRYSLPLTVTSVVKEMRFESVGFARRLYCCVESFFSQGDINHITGDIHFVAPFLTKKKTILTIHDLGFMHNRKGITRLVLKWFWITFPAKRVAMITTVSEATKSELLKYSSIDPIKIRVIYNPISSAFSKRSKLFNKDMPTLLQVGTTPNKNILRLIAAIQDLPCKLYVLGTLDAECKKEIDSLNIDYKEFRNLSVREVVDLYELSDIVCFASTVEGFGLPIVEANTVGRVVVTSNISSMPEIASNAAHYVDPFNIQSIRQGIVMVIQNDLYREQLIENGYVNRRRFNISLIAHQYLDLYNELLGNEGVSPIVT